MTTSASRSGIVSVWVGVLEAILAPEKHSCRQGQTTVHVKTAYFGQQAHNADPNWKVQELGVSPWSLKRWSKLPYSQPLGRMFMKPDHSVIDFPECKYIRMNLSAF